MLAAADRSASFRLTPLNLLSFALGACALWLFEQLPPTGWLVVTAVVVAVAALALRPRERHAVLCALLGFTCAHASAQDALAIRLSPTLEGIDLVAVGVIDDLPARDADGLRFRFCPETVMHGDRAVASGGCWRLGWYVPRHRGPGGHGDVGALPVIEPGSRWRLTVRLKRPRGLVNPGGFDSERKALETRIAAVGYVRDDGANAALSPASGIDAVRHDIAIRIDRALAGQLRLSALLRGLAIGDRRGFDETDWLVFRQTGTTHLFSISGLHVGMIAIFVGLLGSGVTWLFPRLLRIAPRRSWTLPPALVAAFGYAVLAGLEVATQRSVAMIAVAGLAVLLRRGAGAWQGWCLALAVVIAIDPLAILSIGFWLSYLGVAWLLLHAQGRRSRSWWRSATQAQWAVTIGLLPVGIGFFAQASWLSPLANLVAIPWITFIVVPVLLLSLPLMKWSETMGEALVQLAAWLLAPLMHGLEVAARWPLASTMFPEPTFMAIACAMFAAALWVMSTSPAVRLLCVPLTLPMLMPSARVPPHGAVEMQVLDVGQGTSILVRTRTRSLLFDAGARFPNGYDLGEAVVVPALRALGVDRLDLLMVSHADNDHAGGAAAVVRELAPVRVLVGEPVPGVPGDPCRENQGWRWDGVDFAVLHPPARYPAHGNDVSCVLRITTAGASALLTGDAGTVAEMRMINLHRDALASDVLVLGHHGSLTSSTPAFMDAVSPMLAIATAGYRNRFGHPHPDVLRRLAWRGVEVLQTSRSGSLRVRLDAAGVRHASRRDERRHVWTEP